MQVCVCRAGSAIMNSQSQALIFNALLAVFGSIDFFKFFHNIEVFQSENNKDVVSVKLSKSYVFSILELLTLMRFFFCLLLFRCASSQATYYTGKRCEKANMSRGILGALIGGTAGTVILTLAIFTVIRRAQ